MKAAAKMNLAASVRQRLLNIARDRRTERICVGKKLSLRKAEGT
jgi:hypothetical protein